MDKAFEVLFTPPAHLKKDTRYDIFLVHGFLGARYGPYRDILERWVANLAKATETSNTPATARVIRFDASLIPTQGRDALEPEVWRLRRVLVQVLHETAHPSPMDDDIQSEHGDDSINEEDISSSVGLPENNDTILLIAHGLGSWLVKDALAHPSSDVVFVTYGRAEVYFVDFDLNFQLEDAYQQYLKRTWTIFNICSPKVQLSVDHDGLADYLREIDENFDTITSLYSTKDDNNKRTSTIRAPQTIHQGQDLAIWMDDDQVDPREPAQSTHISGMLHKKQTAATQAQVLRALPGSLGDMECLGLRPKTSGPFGVSTLSRPLEGNWPPGSSATAPEQLYAEGQLRRAPSSPSIGPDGAYEDTNFLSHGTLGSREPQEPFVDSDSDSGVLTPSVEFNVMPSGHSQVAYKLANSFVQVGELKSAQVLFEKMLEQLSRDPQSFEAEVFIRTRIAVMKMYRGNYEDSRKDFLAMLENISLFNDMNQEQRNESLYVCHRWLANCRLLAGQWDAALSEMQALLEAKPDKYHVRLHRDMALAHSYLGQYDAARKSLDLALSALELSGFNDQEEGDNEPDRMSKPSTARQDEIEMDRRQNAPEDISNEEKEIRTKERSVQAAKATFEMLSGNYPAALASSSKALNFMKESVGVKHIRTLSVTVLHTWCLAYNGRYTEAETLCSTAYTATARALGRGHPQTLEAMCCLVYIFRCQGRFAEAIGTGISLDVLSEEGMKHVGKDHPQPISAKFQLANAYLSNGHYMRSRDRIREAVAHATRIMGEKHPETLRCKSEQARVALYLGNVSEARELAFAVVVQQFELYSKTESIEVRMKNLCKAFEAGHKENRLSQVKKLLDLALEDTSSPVMLHPFLISTVQLIANIEIRKSLLIGLKSGDADLDTAEEILITLRDAVSTRLAKNDILISSLNFDLATLYKEGSTEVSDLNKAVEHLDQVYKIRKEKLGDSHLDTLCAHRNLTIAKCLHGISSDNSDTVLLSTVKKVSDTIFKSVRLRLGRLHPETLASQLWCFTVNLLLQHDESLEESSREDLIRNLSEPQVMQQSLVEALGMKRQLAVLLVGTGKAQESLTVVDGAILEIEDAERDSEYEGLKDLLSDLKETFQELKVDN